MGTCRRQSPAVRFSLDEEKAARFLGRALRRHAGALNPGEGAGAGQYESWELAPGWDLMSLYSDEAPHVESLVWEALREAGAITCTVEGADVELLIDVAPGDGWMYQWRVSLPGNAGFALCSPYREDFRSIGWDDGSVRSKGCAAALGILREACTAANEILAHYERLGGRAASDAAPGRPRRPLAARGRRRAGPGRRRHPATRPPRA